MCINVKVYYALIGFFLTAKGKKMSQFHQRTNDPNGVKST